MSETYTGQVQNGVVVFDEGTPPPPEGTKVRVEPADADMEAAVRDLSRRLLSVAGKAKGLPVDLAKQHDHYIHGTPQAMIARFADTFYRHFERAGFRALLREM